MSSVQIFTALSSEEVFLVLDLFLVIDEDDGELDNSGFDCSCKGSGAIGKGICPNSQQLSPDDDDDDDEGGDGGGDGRDCSGGGFSRSECRNNLHE